MKTMNMISRRSFLKAATAAAVVSALGLTGCGSSGSSAAASSTASSAAGSAAAASEAGQTFKVGIVNYVDHASLNQIVASVESRLDEVGAEKGVTFDYADYYANAQADQSNLNQIGADLVADQVDVIVAVATPTAATMLAAVEDTDIPVVYSAVTDPVSAGFDGEEGITGTSTCKRKEFLRMIRQCRQGKIDMILAKSVSRFARNTVDTLNFTRELRSLGIPVIFEEQNINSIYPESEFLITLHGAFAQAESESTSSRVRWGKRQAMKSGHVAMQYKQLLGYEKGPDGKPRIVPEQAETVRFIYQRYLAGDTLRAIKSKLEAQGALNAIGKQEWTIKNLLSILSNEKYCGDALLQKRKKLISLSIQDLLPKT